MTTAKPAGEVSDQPKDEELIEQSRRLFEDEIPWMKRHDYLLNSGYRLRPRYSPSWKASWTGFLPSPENEDAIPMVFHGNIMDAQRVSDDTTVMMKVVARDAEELIITKFLSSEQLRSDVNNHCVPLLDILDDPLNGDRCIMVLPLLRPAQNPPFASVGDCVEFVEQMPKALVFLHEHGVAHRDCFVENIMMDGRALYSRGWHPQALGRARNGRIMSAAPKRRAAGGVRYYLIDYGISTLSQSEFTGIRGQKQAPELTETTPYNSFKVDIWLLGSCFGYMITEKFRNVEWLNTLVEAMTQTDPSARPTAIECVSQFDGIKAKIKFLARAQRLHPLKTESRLLQTVRDTTYLISEGFWTLKMRSKKSLTPFPPTEKGSEPQAVATEEAETDGQASVKESAAVPQDTDPNNNKTINEPSKPNPGNPEP